MEIYRPIDMSRWNRALYHTVSNRGGAGAAETALLERGFAFVRVGWQGDLTPTGSNIVAYLPVASSPDGSSIVGPALEEFIFNDAESVSRGRLTYPAASLEPRGGMLSVRATQDADRMRPDDLQWRYVSDTEIEIDRPAGFDGGAIYEFIYEARDPIVLGLGFAAMRDAVSFLRYEAADGNGNANPLAAPGLPTSATSLGISQSGRMLRDFLYQGFNEDVAGRIVFDGMHPNIAGSRKTFTNYQFGQPGRWQKQHEDHVYPGDQFPFTYATLTDPLSGPDGRTAGTMRGVEHLPEDRAQRRRGRAVAGALVAGGHRPGGRAHRAAGERARLSAVGHAARRRSRRPHADAEPGACARTRAIRWRWPRSARR